VIPFIVFYGTAAIITAGILVAASRDGGAGKVGAFLIIGLSIAWPVAVAVVILARGED
jgi:hypothetical protein